MKADNRVLSIDDVLTVVNRLIEKEKNNCAAYCAWNPGKNAREREKVRDYTNASYNLVYYELLEIAKKRR